MRARISGPTRVSLVPVAYLFLAVFLGCAEAGEISRLHRGAWAKNGDCEQSQRIVLGETTIQLVERGRVRTLIDGEEAVFKGKTLINASLPAKGKEDAVLGFSGKLSDAAGPMKLVADGVEKGEFSGTFMRCKGQVSRVGRVANHKPKPIMRNRRVMPAHHFVRPRPVMLGGFY